MKDECQIRQCSKCKEPYSRTEGSGVMLCYGCWCKSHPCRVKEAIDQGEIDGPGEK